MTKKKKQKISEEESEEIVSNWINSIDDLRDFFYQHCPEEEGDVFYDNFLEKFQNIVNVFNSMVELRMIVSEDDLEYKKEQQTINTGTKKGLRHDN